jgi:hypothetical protein
MPRGDYGKYTKVFSKYLEVLKDVCNGRDSKDYEDSLFLPIKSDSGKIAIVYFTVQGVGSSIEVKRDTKSKDSVYVYADMNKMVPIFLRTNVEGGINNIDADMSKVRVRSYIENKTSSAFPSNIVPMYKFSFDTGTVLSYVYENSKFRKEYDRDVDLMLWESYESLGIYLRDILYLKYRGD